MTERVRMVPCYPWPLTDIQMSMLKNVKENLNLSYLIQPRPAVPGSPGIMLAFGQMPNFVCDYAMVPAMPDFDKVEAALRVVLDNDLTDPRLGHPINVLQSINPGYRKVTE
jgi:hypothetical protein